MQNLLGMEEIVFLNNYFSCGRAKKFIDEIVMEKVHDYCAVNLIKIELSAVVKLINFYDTSL